MQLDFSLTFQIQTKMAYLAEVRLFMCTENILGHHWEENGDLKEKEEGSSC